MPVDGLNQVGVSPLGNNFAGIHLGNRSACSNTVSVVWMALAFINIFHCFNKQLYSISFYFGKVKQLYSISFYFGKVFQTAMKTKFAL